MPEGACSNKFKIKIYRRNHNHGQVHPGCRQAAGAGWWQGKHRSGQPLHNQNALRSERSRTGKHRTIEAIPSVKGSFTQAGQFQVIIGNTVADFYNDFVAISGIEGVSKDEAKSAAKQNQNALQRIMTALAEIFAPLIPAIITGGLILGFRNVIDSMYIFAGGTATWFS